MNQKIDISGWHTIDPDTYEKFIAVANSILKQRTQVKPKGFFGKLIGYEQYVPPTSWVEFGLRVEIEDDNHILYKYNAQKWESHFNAVRGEVEESLV